MAESGASRLESISRGIAVSAIVVGILAAFGWIFDIEFLRNVYAELPATRMNEGIAMVLGGFSLWMTGGKPLRWERIAAAVSAAVLFGIGVVTLAEHLGSVSLGIDRLLYHSSGLANVADQRMTPPSALACALVGLGLLLLNLTKAAYTSDAVGALASLIGQFALTGYGLASSNLYSSVSYGGIIPIAVLWPFSRVRTSAEWLAADCFR